MKTEDNTNKIKTEPKWSQINLAIKPQNKLALVAEHPKVSKVCIQAKWKSIRQTQDF